MKHYLIGILFAMTGSLASAHEGHNEAPGSIKALHGGMVTQGKEFNLEVFSSNGELKLYPLNHSGGDIPLAEVKITATAQPPEGKSASVTLETKDGAYYSKHASSEQIKPVAGT